MRCIWRALLVVVCACAVAVGAGVGTGNHTHIAIHGGNPLYFAFRGRCVSLVSSSDHYGSLINLGFDYSKYLRALHANNYSHTQTFSGAYVEPDSDCDPTGQNPGELGCSARLGCEGGCVGSPLSTNRGTARSAAVEASRRPWTKAAGRQRRRRRAPARRVARTRAVPVARAGPPCLHHLEPHFLPPACR